MMYDVFWDIHKKKVFKFVIFFFSQLVSAIFLKVKNSTKLENISVNL